jgi:hypothetical protein
MNQVKITKRTHVVLPEHVVKDIDALVGKKKRSTYITAVLEAELLHTRQKQAFAAAFGSWKDENHPDLHTQKDVVQYVRQIRDESDKRQKRYGKQSRQS